MKVFARFVDAKKGSLKSTVWKEWKLYCELLPEKPIIRELHLGGGTPTFFSPENLKKLVDGIFERSEKHPEAEFSFEGHPNNEI